MKKVFAILSVLALTIALVGFTSSKISATEKWTTDPTLGENEIPLYIMDSIYTTFPNYYDNDDTPDEKWIGVSRMYPWNETRLQIRQIDAQGEWTGKEYAIYFTGALSASDQGTGNNILFYTKDEGGNLVLGRMNNGTWGSSGIPMDGSLSHMRKNVTGEDIEFDPLKLWSSNGGNFLNRVFVFDGNGRMIKAVLNSSAYAKQTGETVTFAPEYCYVDGVVTKAGDGVVCDKIMADDLDADGNIIYEDDGVTPKQHATDEDNYLYERFVWEWISADRFNADDFVGVNEVPYLSEGWDAMKWDYYEYEEESDGYVCIAFLAGQSSTAKLSAAQLAVYTATCEANGLDEPTASTTRACWERFYVPAGGFTYDYGYLDQGLMDDRVNDFFIQGFYHGRKLDVTYVDVLDENGEQVIDETTGQPKQEKVEKGMAYQKTVNFSVSPVHSQDVVYNGQSYQVMEGQNTVEVLQGETIVPAKNVVYTGVTKYWAVENDLTSFTADPAACEMYISLNGLSAVAPSTGYTNFDDIVTDFLTDWSNWKTNSAAEKKEITVDKLRADLASGDSTFHATLGWGGVFTTNSTNAALVDSGAPSFMSDKAMNAKWMWLFEKIYEILVSENINNQGIGNYQTALNSNYASSPETIHRVLGMFFNGTSHDYFGCDFTNGKNSDWIDTRSNLDKWNTYSIDTSVLAVDTNLNVAFRVKNNSTGIDSALNIKYVVVDEYTPILTVNSKNLIIANAENAIDPFTFVNAYNGKYNGDSILGDDITYKVKFESELDFNAPTEGKHEVKATVYSASGAKFATKTFEVRIQDNTAPRVFCVDSLVLAYGSYWTPAMGVTYCWDAVEGDMMDNHFRGWCVDVSNNTVNVKKPGKYTVKLEISDESGNVVNTSYQVEILEPVSLTDVEDNLDEVLGIVNAQNEKFEELEEQIKALSDKIDALNNEVGTVKDQTTKGCGGKSALVMVEILAAASVVVVFLRKKH